MQKNLFHFKKINAIYDLFYAVFYFVYLQNDFNKKKKKKKKFGDEMMMSGIR
jgi:hypothetical protein